MLLERGMSGLLSLAYSNPVPERQQIVDGWMDGFLKIFGCRLDVMEYKLDQVQSELYHVDMNGDQ